MGVIKSWNFLKGYVIIRVEGMTLERFLNLAANNDVYLWDINRIDYTLLEMKATIEGFRVLKEIVKKLGCRVDIVDKRGLPFIIYKLKHRKMLGIGFILFFIIIIFLSSIIWNIEIIGNKKIEEKEILKFLEKENVKQGIIKYKIDNDYIEKLLLKEFDIFSFVSIEIKGTNLIIEVREQDLVPNQIDKSIPSNIVAAKKGIIEKVIAKNGKAKVKEGDVVEKGDILISGIISDEYSENNIWVHAEGEVLAKTLYSYKVEEPIIKNIKEETGKVYEIKEIKIGSRSIQFVKGDIPFEDYIESVEEVKIFNIDIDLPIKILVHKYKEVETKTKTQDIELIKSSNHIKAVKELNKLLPSDAEIISKEAKHYVKDGIVTTYVILEVVENIGISKPLNQ